MRTLSLAVLLCLACGGGESAPPAKATPGFTVGPDAVAGWAGRGRFDLIVGTDEAISVAGTFELIELGGLVSSGRVRGKLNDRSEGALFPCWLIMDGARRQLVAVSDDCSSGVVVGEVSGTSDADHIYTRAPFGWNR